MAGSLSHIVDEETGHFRMGFIENMGDAYEALDECFKIIHHLTGGNKEYINRICDDLGFPTIDHNMVLGGKEELN